MICEYPSYYEKFSCIGDKCKDTCCAGWEVDVDPDSAEYYKNIKGEFGERLRKHMSCEDGNYYFPLTEKKKCPFLNASGLCDMYTAIGEESLCQVCTEYPRYFVDVNNYEQIDMSLSCMEVGRLMFESPEDITYIRAENDIPSPEFTEESQDELIQIMALRNQTINLLCDRTISFRDAYKETFAMTSVIFPDLSDDTIAKGLDSLVLGMMKKFEVIDQRWLKEIKEIEKNLEEIELHTDELINLNDEVNTYFRKFACYLVFRYFIDVCFTHDIEKQLQMAVKAGRITVLMCTNRYLQNDKKFGLEDMIYMTHLFSKEVEHSEENLEILRS